MKTMTFALAALVGGLIFTGPVQSRTMDQQVVVASQFVHPIRVGAGGLSVEQRVDRINERLNRIIAREPLSPSNIKLKMVGTEPGIFAGRSLITTVTQADADANNSTPLRLARQWLSAYRHVLPQARPGQNWGVRER
jgi:hypothetical protein